MDFKPHYIYEDTRVLGSISKASRCVCVGGGGRGGVWGGVGVCVCVFFVLFWFWFCFLFVCLFVFCLFVCLFFVLFFLFFFPGNLKRNGPLSMLSSAINKDFKNGSLKLLTLNKLRY